MPDSDHAPRAGSDPTRSGPVSRLQRLAGESPPPLAGNPETQDSESTDAPDDSSPAQDHRLGGSAILRRILTYSPGSIIPAGLTLATSMVFTRVFSAEEYGAFGLALVYATMLKAALSNWLSLGVSRFLPPEDTLEGQRLVKSAIVLSAFAMLAMEVLAGVAVVLVVAVLGESQSLAIPAAIWVVAISLYEVLSAVFAAEHRAPELASYQVASSVAVFALRIGLVLTVFAGDISVMFWSLVAVYAALNPLLWWRAGLPPPTPATLRAALGGPDIRQISRTFLRFGIPMTLWVVTSILMDVGDRFVINTLIGTSAVGIYDANYRLVGGLISLVLVPIAITLYPYLMAVSGSGDTRRVGLALGVIVQDLIVLGTLITGIVFVFRNDLARLLGPEFRGGSVIMPIVLAGMFSFSIGSYTHKPFEIEQRMTPMVALAFIAAGLNIALNFTLIPHVGYLGAAYATFVSYTFYAVAVGAMGRRLIPWRIAKRQTLRTSLPIVFGVILTAGLRHVLATHTPLGGLAVAILVSAMLSLWTLRHIRKSVTILR